MPGIFKATYFFDASAIVKMVVREPGSQKVMQLLERNIGDPQPRILNRKAARAFHDRAEFAEVYFRFDPATPHLADGGQGLAVDLG